MQLPGVPLTAGDTRKNLASEQGLENLALRRLQGKTTRDARRKTLLKFDQSRQKLLRGGKGMGHTLYKPLEAEVYWNRRKIKGHGFGKPIPWCCNDRRTGKGVPLSLPLKTDLNGVGSSSFCNGDIPISSFKGDLDFLFKDTRGLFHS